MGRKNKRMDGPSDSNFDKFVSSINTGSTNTTHSTKRVFPVKKEVPYTPKVQKPIVKLIEQTVEQRNAARLEFAEKKFAELNIQYEIKDAKTGRMFLYRKSDNAVIQFTAATGAITGFQDLRGINAVIKLITE